MEFGGLANGSARQLDLLILGIYPDVYRSSPADINAEAFVVRLC